MTAMDDTTMEARAIRVVANPGGGGTVEVDGRDLTSAVRGVTVVAGPYGTLPQVILDLAARHDPTVVEGFAQVVVGVAPDPDPGPAAATFLAAIDPQALEQAALNHPNLGGGPHALTEAMLQVLIGWAEGRS